MEIINNQENNFNHQLADALNHNQHRHQANPPAQNPRVLAQDMDIPPAELPDVDYINNQMLNNHPELRREREEPRDLIFDINEAFRRAHEEGGIAGRRNNKMRALQPMIR